MLQAECLVVCLVEWAVWVEWVEWECNRSNPNQNSKRAVFTALFFYPKQKSAMKFAMNVQ
jgi:hypothetical protein